MLVYEPPGLTGMIVLDDRGDREPDYWITDMMPNGTFVKIAEVLNTDNGARVREYWRRATTAQKTNQKIYIYDRILSFVCL